MGECKWSNEASRRCLATYRIIKTLGITVGLEIIVLSNHLVESKLPRATIDKWEATLKRDEFPQSDQIYKFIYKTAVFALRRERARASETKKDKNGPSAKWAGYNPSNRTFMIKTLSNCVVCKAKQHPLHLCDKFKQMSVQERKLEKRETLLQLLALSSRDSLQIL